MLISVRLFGPSLCRALNLHLSLSGQSQVSLRSVPGQSQVSLRSVSGQSALYCWSTPSWLKVMGLVVVGGGGQSDYCVSPSPNNWVLGFCTLGLNLGSGFRAFSMLIYIYILVN